MIKRPTWIMVIVLALLAGLAYYLTTPDNLAKKALDAGKTPTATIASIESIPLTDAPINGLEISASDGHSVTLKHESTGWTLSVDMQAFIPADQGAATQAAAQAQTLKLTGLEIKSNPADLSGFGLDKPVYNYKVTLESGKIFNFKIGKVTIIGDGYYLQKEDGTIAVVDKSSMDALLTLLKQPPSMFTATPSAAPTTEEVPTGTITPIPAATATPGS